MGVNEKNAGNQGGDVENQGGNLGIAAEMKQESNRNGKFKEWREVKVIENEHICKNLVLHIQFYKIYFQFYFGNILHNAFLILLLNLDRKIRFGKALRSKMEDLCVFHI